MLPFLKPRQVAGIIISKRKADGAESTEGTEGQTSHELLEAAEDFIRATHAKDAQGVADAFEKAFKFLDSQPHEEGPHIESEGENE